MYLVSAVAVLVHCFYHQFACNLTTIKLCNTLLIIFNSFKYLSVFSNCRMCHWYVHTPQTVHSVAAGCVTGGCTPQTVHSVAAGCVTGVYTLQTVHSEV